MKYQLSNNIMRQDDLRAAFNELAVSTFQVSFEEWYQKGYWSERNVPYGLFDQGRLVTSVSVNHMELLYRERSYRYIQLGTVMTDRAYRNQGLCGELMKTVLTEWTPFCDSIFLFANRNVLDFYPRFGFEKQKYYQYSMPVRQRAKQARQLNIDNPDDLTILSVNYAKTNPFSILQVTEDFGLLMFHCLKWMKNCIYYSQETEAVMIGKTGGNILHCYDIYCRKGQDFADVISRFVPADVEKIVFGFTPNEDLGDFEIEESCDEDSTLFVLKGKDSMFEREKLMFPMLFHT
ncbi:MAG: GNAT family N-acetyltransferase [Lachnospiraceae bacterium]